MPDLGVAYFDPPFILPQNTVWFDGAYLTRLALPPRTFDQDPLGSVVDFHAGNSAIVKVYRGAKSPLAWDRRHISISLIAADQADYDKIHGTRAKGAGFWFADGTRVIDQFQATATATYTLSRRRAKGIVTSVDEVDYETIILLDGVVDAAAASIGANEQTVTALKTGLIEIRYTPVFWMFMGAIAEDHSTYNTRVLSFLLDEAPVGDFT